MNDRGRDPCRLSDLEAFEDLVGRVERAIRRRRRGFLRSARREHGDPLTLYRSMYNPSPTPSSDLLQVEGGKKDNVPFRLPWKASRH